MFGTKNVVLRSGVIKPSLLQWKISEISDWRLNILANWKPPIAYGALSIQYLETGDNFLPNGTVKFSSAPFVCKKQFFLWGIKWNGSFRCQFQEINRLSLQGAPGLVIFWSILQKREKRNTSKVIPCFPRNFQWEKLFHLLSYQNDRFFHSKGILKKCSWSLVCRIFNYEQTREHVYL